MHDPLCRAAAAAAVVVAAMMSNAPPAMATSQLLVDEDAPAVVLVETAASAVARVPAFAPNATAIAAATRQAIAERRFTAAQLRDRAVASRFVAHLFASDPDAYVTPTAGPPIEAGAVAVRITGTGVMVSPHGTVLTAAALVTDAAVKSRLARAAADMVASDTSEALGLASQELAEVATFAASYTSKHLSLTDLVVARDVQLGPVDAGSATSPGRRVATLIGTGKRAPEVAVLAAPLTTGPAVPVSSHAEGTTTWIGFAVADSFGNPPKLSSPVPAVLRTEDAPLGSLLVDRTGNLVGLRTAVAPMQIAQPADLLEALLSNNRRADKDPSRRTYGDAVRLASGNHWRAAQARFETAKHLSPENPLVGHQIASAVAAIEAGRDVAVTKRPVVALAVATLLELIVVVAGIVLIRRYGLLAR